MRNNRRIRGPVRVSGSSLSGRSRSRRADLITVRGLRILQSADVVLHDALISPELLAEAGPHAELVSVGKRGYCVGSTKQETINDALVRFAREGKSVCRLKCGDPCVFGRGGEEAEVLAEAGVPFEIVPGVTSAVGRVCRGRHPADAPRRGQAVALVTGHHDPDSARLHPRLGRAGPTAGGRCSTWRVRHVAKIAAKLSDSGLSPDTPGRGNRERYAPEAARCRGRAERHRRRRGSAAISGPAVFVVGEVVRRAINRPLPAGGGGHSESRINERLASPRPAGYVREVSPT